MRKVFFSMFVFFVVLCFLSVKPVFAKIISSQNNEIEITKTEIVNDDLFVTAQNVVIDGTVNGDVFAIAQSIRITGIINGNVHAGTQFFDLSGNVKGNVYVGGQKITVAGADISGSLLAGGQNISIDTDSNIGGALLAGGAFIRINSTVDRSAYIGTGSLTLGPDVTIGKDLYYTAGENQARIDSSAKIMGSIYKTEYEMPEKNAEVAKKQTLELIKTTRLAGSIISFISSLIVGYIYLRISGKKLTDMSKMITKTFWKCFGFGFLITVCLLPGLLLLLITVVGIPIAGLALLLFLLYSYLAKIVVGTVFGQWLGEKFKWKLSSFWSIALGLLAIYLLQIIPVIGLITHMIVLWVGLGALSLKLFSEAK